MARRGTKSKNELIKCEYCGEMYSVTYKHCPFCNEDGTGRWDDPDSGGEEEYYEEPRRGGKRLMGGSGGRSGPSVGGVIWFIVSLALIIAAVCIVVSLVKSMISGKKGPDDTEPSAPPPVEDTYEPSAQPTAQVDDTPMPAASETPQVQVTTPAVELTKPTAFTLNREDFTFNAAGQVFNMAVTFTPADAHAEVVWKSSDPNVASVSWSGMVTAVSPGTVTLTATVEGVGEKTCIVRCNFQNAAAAATPAPSTGTAAPSTSGLSLSREDFTLGFAGDSWRLVVSGTSSAVTWATSDSSVATVSGDGTVTAVGSGRCTVTATVDGVTLKCIVRCGF